MCPHRTSDIHLEMTAYQWVKKSRVQWSDTVPICEFEVRAFLRPKQNTKKCFVLLLEREGMHYRGCTMLHHKNISWGRITRQYNKETLKGEFPFLPNNTDIKTLPEMERKIKVLQQFGSHHNEKWTINMKTRNKNCFILCCVGILSLLKNLPLSFLKTNDRSERNLQLWIRPGALNGGTVPGLAMELDSFF